MRAGPAVTCLRRPSAAATRWTILRALPWPPGLIGLQQPSVAALRLRLWLWTVHHMTTITWRRCNACPVLRPQIQSWMLLCARELASADVLRVLRRSGTAQRCTRLQVGLQILPSLPDGREADSNGDTRSVLAASSQASARWRRHLAQPSDLAPPGGRDSFAQTGTTCTKIQSSVHKHAQSQLLSSSPRRSICNQEERAKPAACIVCSWARTQEDAKRSRGPLVDRRWR